MTSLPRPLQALVHLATIDGKLLAIGREQEGCKKDLQNSRLQATAALTLSREAQQLRDTRQTYYNTRERAIEEERRRLEARSENLATFSNYKVQQNAEKEIQHLQSALGEQEDALLSVMEEIEQLDAKARAAAASAKQAQQRLSEVELSIVESLEVLEDRAVTLRQERAAIIANLAGDHVTLYERIHAKFPGNPVAKLVNGSCEGCFMKAGPQVLVQMVKGDTIPKCLGCGRILYTDQLPGENAPGE